MRVNHNQMITEHAPGELVADYWLWYLLNTPRLIMITLSGIDQDIRDEENPLRQFLMVPNQSAFCIDALMVV